MLGLLTILLSALLLTFHNLTVRVLYSDRLVLGWVELGGYVQPTLQNSFLLMFLRMLVVVPLMAAIAPKIYPAAQQDFKDLVTGDRQSALIASAGCGVLMFVYIAMLYIAIGSIPTGIALTLFFTYPVFTALFSWRWLGDRLTQFRWLVMAIILVGCALTVPPSEAASNSGVAIGIATSLGAGVIYALYTVAAQRCFAQIHPVPFTWISFAITLILSGLSLLIMPFPTVELAWTPLWIGSIFSGLTSFAGHSLNNIGIRMVGATATAMIGSSSPALTALMAWATIDESIDTIQAIGIGIVTLGIALLSSEKKLGRSR
ncbi:DMT family transporter [Microcoleus sp. FACHB-1515]|uniref:DMT family transporter n=1 Tax=Cyanophyceae TaxID=3028117 RepID=UPI001689DC3B|nr:DMT family transporter [Microcoleus sp. FACHB-1515]MBD2089810.1 DMT family transporter [Microcoleus sp. FACHB-1515]